jgi:hypothetical protein
VDDKKNIGLPMRRKPKMTSETHIGMDIGTDSWTESVIIKDGKLTETGEYLVGIIRKVVTHKQATTMINAWPEYTAAFKVWAAEVLNRHKDQEEESADEV